MFMKTLDFTRKDGSCYGKAPNVGGLKLAKPQVGYASYLPLRNYVDLTVLINLECETDTLIPSILG
jgi:hypothetical protein